VLVVASGVWPAGFVLVLVTVVSAEVLPADVVLAAPRLG
jgi:hypothetical protein